jgi:hypothetical protein
MAIEEGLKKISVEAGADLSAAANLYKCVKLDSNGNAVICSAITDKTIGSLQDLGKQGRAVPVSYEGIAKFKAGATIAAGDPVATKADGTLQVAATTQYVIGIARWGGVSGDIISVLQQPAVLKA